MITFFSCGGGGWEEDEEVKGNGQRETERTGAVLGKSIQQSIQRQRQNVKQG